MATELTLEGYLKDNSRVKAARKKLEAAGKKLDTAKRALNSARNASPEIVKDIKASIESARLIYNSIKTETSAIENKATADFKKNYKSISTEINKKSLTELQSSLPKAKSSEEYKAIQDAINKIQGKIANPQEYKDNSFKVISPASGVIGSQPNTGMQVEDFASTLKGSRAELKKMSGDQLEALGLELQAAGIQAPAVKVYTDELWNAYKGAISAAQNAYNSNKEFPTLNAFLKDRQIQFAALNPKGTGGAGGPTTSLEKSISISAPTEARAFIQQQFRDILGREATPDELVLFTQKLNDAEKKNAQRAKRVTSQTGSGTSTSATYSGGLNKQEFLAEQIKKLPEYSKKKAEAASLTTQSIQSTIRANGLNLPAEQIAAWTKAVESGTKLDVVLNQIRDIAAVGMPDNVKKMLAGGTDLSTIFSPYRNTMAAVLELNPDAIDLNDPTLRNAIGPDGEMPVYQFQRELRKDPRWQYTNNAREDISNSVTKVLQDFGFQG